MKKTILYLLIFLAAGMTACFEDDSTLGSDFIPDITIAELRDTAIVSYAGNVLEITPQVTSEYDESELSYAWYIYNESNGTTTGGSEVDGFGTEKIVDAKTLSYELNIPSGLYGIVFEVTEARNGYARRAFMSLSVSTAFSQGFYILKETADGRSDLDLAFNGNFSEDILTNRIGAPLDGAPVNLSILYGQGYIDGKTQEMAYTKGLNVFTEEDYRAFRTEDFYQIQDLSTVFYSGEPQEGEVLYGAYQGMMYNFYFSNKGYYGVNACGGMFGYENSGKIGFPIGAGGSKYAQNLMGGFGGTAYWNEIDRTVVGRTTMLPSPRWWITTFPQAWTLQRWIASAVASIMLVLRKPNGSCSVTRTIIVAWCSSPVRTWGQASWKSTLPSRPALLKRISWQVMPSPSPLSISSPATSSGRTVGAATASTTSRSPVWKGRLTMSPTSSSTWTTSPEARTRTSTISSWARRLRRVTTSISSTM